MGRSLNNEDVYQGQSSVGDEDVAYGGHCVKEPHKSRPSAMPSPHYSRVDTRSQQAFHILSNKIFFSRL